MSEQKTRRSCGECCTRLVNFGVRLGDVPILEKINLHMHCGELTAIIGPNGAGKTTLLKALVGEVAHTGLLRFVHQGMVEDARPLRTGYVPQKLEFDATTPTTVLDLFASATCRWPLWISVRRPVREDARRVLAVVGAEHLLTRKLCQISVGQLQRVLLALALTPVPELLLLDEPAASLDRAGTELFYQTISELRQHYDLSVLLVSHDLVAAARVADRMILLNRTVLSDGTARAVLADPLIRQTFGFGFGEHDLPPPATAGQDLGHTRCELPIE
jgi:zinc transport system ATP-binding protein